MCVNDLMIEHKTPEAIFSLLQDKCKLKLKVTGPIKYHLGCDFSQYELSTLCCTPRKYIEKMADA